MSGFLQRILASGMRPVGTVASAGRRAPPVTVSEQMANEEHPGAAPAARTHLATPPPVVPMREAALVERVAIPTHSPETPQTVAVSLSRAVETSIAPARSPGVPVVREEIAARPSVSDARRASETRPLRAAGIRTVAPIPSTPVRPASPRANVPLAQVFVQPLAPDPQIPERQSPAPAFVKSPHTPPKQSAEGQPAPNQIAVAPEIFPDRLPIRPIRNRDHERPFSSKSLVIQNLEVQVVNESKPAPPAVAPQPLPEIRPAGAWQTAARRYLNKI